MVASAPRYQERLLCAIRRLDDESLSIAEVCRRVGAYAEDHGMARPSYVHVRRIIVSERARARELAEIQDEMLTVLVRPMPPDLVGLSQKRQDVLARDRFRPGRVARDP